MTTKPKPMPMPMPKPKTQPLTHAQTHALRVDLDGVGWAAGGRTILRGVSFAVEPGETVGLVGPNGSGKSSLLRCAAGLRAPSEGTVRLDGEDVRDWSPRRLARRLAFVEQVPHAESELRLAEVVALGRTPFRSRWRGPNAADDAIVEAAMERLGLVASRDRAWRTLSGGERQRAHLARALAQRSWGLFLDEPTNHLDVRHQLELMELLAATDQTVVVALHDLSLAARYCDRLLLLHDGTLVADGPPEAVLTPERLRDVFGVAGRLGHDSLGNPAVAYGGVFSRIHEGPGRTLTRAEVRDAVAGAVKRETTGEIIGETGAGPAT
ncbi:ABC transporter ATP-binding protein [Streptomyces sp. 4N509B]|uniref:ABC transporter ATP-binding protein n=1 Tax=Streptomyces sp. 4N509B TaxID=3457413 RepID=UPI003FD049F1